MPDIVTSQVFTDGEKGITATKMNNIIANSVIQPDFVTAKPSSSTLDPTDQLLEVKGAGTYARITGQQLIDSVSASVSQNITPTITAVRLRSFNSLGNPNFEVDQINIGNTVANANAKIIDRWPTFKTGTMAVSAGQILAPLPDACVPGTNFRISRASYRVTLTTAQAVLGASDQLFIYQEIEGPQWRELSNDVHSLSLLVRTSIAGLKFGVSLRDPPTSTKSLTKLCTLPSSATWTMITLSNLPVWASGGGFNSGAGAQAYRLSIVLAAGSTLTSPANDTWQNGNFNGALGQDNFAAQAVNSTFDIAFVQHEPGAQCTTPIDCPFTQNLIACQRYYQKSYEYPTKSGTVTAAGRVITMPFAAQQPYCYVPFKQTMAKTPTTINGFSDASGTFGTVRDNTAAIDRTISAAANPADSGFCGFTATTTNAASALYTYQWSADTGW